jgi:hypothetical protein
MKPTRILAVAILCMAFIVPAGFAATMKSNVHDDATRLAALLQDAQTNVSVSAGVWKTIGNEANSIANKLYGHTSGSAAARKLATQARSHVRMFREAALAGNADEARKHAAEAAPFVNQLIDWSSPATKM